MTGASRGIGAATAKLAATRGYDVAVNYLRDAKAADEVVAAVKKAGQRAIAIQGDMAREDDIDAHVRDDRQGARAAHASRLQRRHDRGHSRVEDADAEMMRDIARTQRARRAACARKRRLNAMSSKQGGQGGAIVLDLLDGRRAGSAGEYVWYAASKGAIDTMTVGLSRELAADSIRVNAVSPGPHRDRTPSARAAGAARADDADPARRHA